MNEELDFALGAMPESLLSVVVDAAHAVVRALDPADIAVAWRPLLRFDRRGLASSAARRQFVAALRKEPNLRGLVVEHLLARSEVVAIAEAFVASDSLQAVTDSADRGDVDLLVAALWASAPTGAGYCLGLCASTAAARRVHDEHVVLVAGLEQRVRQADIAAERAQARAAEAEANVARSADALRDERATRRGREQAISGELAAAQRSVTTADSKLAEQRSIVLGLEQRLAKVSGDAAGLDEALKASRREYALLQQAIAAAPVAADDVKLLAREAESLRVKLDAIAQKIAAAPVAPTAAVGKSVAQLRASSGASSSPAASQRPAAPTRRTRPNLPGGMVGDTSDGMGALLTRTADLVMIVDGYNVSQGAWPESPLSEQREKLARALHQIHVRYGCDVVCCFDGDGTEGVRPIRRAGLRVVFSARGQEADELVVDQVAGLPKRVPVVVVSSDAWVREHAERAGAMVISASTVLDVARQAGRR